MYITYEVSLFMILLRLGRRPFTAFGALMAGGTIAFLVAFREH